MSPLLGHSLALLIPLAELSAATAKCMDEAVTSVRLINLSWTSNAYFGRGGV